MNITKKIFLSLNFVFLFSCSIQTNYVIKAHELFDNGDYSSSIFYYSKAINENKSIAVNYYYRGLAWLMIKEYDLAISDFSKTIELDKYYVNAYINRGSIWKEKGQLEKALVDYNRVVKLKTSDMRALEERAELLFANKQFKMAIADYNFLIEKKYNLANTYRQRADAKYFIFDYDGAIRDYCNSIILDPKEPYAYNNLAWIQATCFDKKYRDGKKAISNAKKAIEMDNNKNFLHTLASAYAEAGMFERSVSILSGIIEKFNLDQNEILYFNKNLQEFKAGKPLFKMPGE